MYSLIGDECFVQLYWGLFAQDRCNTSLFLRIKFPGGESIFLLSRGNFATNCSQHASDCRSVSSFLQTTVKGNTILSGKFHVFAHDTFTSWRNGYHCVCAQFLRSPFSPCIARRPFHKGLMSSYSKLKNKNLVALTSIIIRPGTIDKWAAMICYIKNCEQIVVSFLQKW